mmetsp:Transcript_24880/g.42132  ORF Transcript_24880/g.42132 Transcript_24880/m.42132 type:complete len:206 (+) Transcript_24880:127-744(+)
MIIPVSWHYRTGIVSDYFYPSCSHLEEPGELLPLRLLLFRLLRRTEIAHIVGVLLIGVLRHRQQRHPFLLLLFLDYFFLLLIFLLLIFLVLVLVLLIHLKFFLFFFFFFPLTAKTATIWRDSLLLQGSPVCKKGIELGLGLVLRLCHLDDLKQALSLCNIRRRAPIIIANSIGVGPRIAQHLRHQPVSSHGGYVQGRIPFRVLDI